MNSPSQVPRHRRHGDRGNVVFAESGHMIDECALYCLSDRALSQFKINPQFLRTSVLLDMVWIAAFRHRFLLLTHQRAVDLSALFVSTECLGESSFLIIASCRFA